MLSIFSRARNLKKRNADDALFVFKKKRKKIMIKKFFFVRYALCLSKLGCGNQSRIFDEDVAQNKFSKKKRNFYKK